MTDSLRVRYTLNGDVHLAYAVVGDGPIDLLVTPATMSHIEALWDDPGYGGFYRRLASFSRLILFDKRGAGLSDPVPIAELPPLEERMDDLRVVMDAAGSERAALFGHVDGGALSMLFAATYPERTTALVLYGAAARWVQGDGYAFGLSPDDIQPFLRYIEEHWGRGVILSVARPDRSADPELRRLCGRLERLSASPAMGVAMQRMLLEADVRDIVPAIRVPTLILNSYVGQFADHSSWLAEHIPGAVTAELEGEPISLEPIGADEIQEFLTGTRPALDLDRMLSTVLYTDIVDSTARSSQAGDERWGQVVEQHDAIVRRQLERFRGREIKTLGDGFLATFDGPARAVRCGCAVRDAVRALNIEVKVGLHTGEIEVRGDDIAGVAVALARRIVDTAAPNQVLASGTVKDLVVGSTLEFTDAGEHALKGISGTWRLWEAGE